jgi:hypothetical protein
VSERHAYRLELSTFDLDVLEDVLTNAIGQHLQRPREMPNLGDEIRALRQIRALREIRSAIFAQEPLRTRRHSVPSEASEGAPLAHSAQERTVADCDRLSRATVAR